MKEFELLNFNQNAMLQNFKICKTESLV